MVERDGVTKIDTVFVADGRLWESRDQFRIFIYLHFTQYVTKSIVVLLAFFLCRFLSLNIEIKEDIRLEEKIQSTINKRHTKKYGVKASHDF